MIHKWFYEIFWMTVINLSLMLFTNNITFIQLFIFNKWHHSGFYVSKVVFCSQPKIMWMVENKTILNCVFNSTMNYIQIILNFWKVNFHLSYQMIKGLRLYDAFVFDWVPLTLLFQDELQKTKHSLDVIFCYVTSQTLPPTFWCQVLPMKKDKEAAPEKRSNTWRFNLRRLNTKRLIGKRTRMNGLKALNGKRPKKSKTAIGMISLIFKA